MPKELHIEISKIDVVENTFESHPLFGASVCMSMTHPEESVRGKVGKVTKVGKTPAGKIKPVVQLEDGRMVIVLNEGEASLLGWAE